MLAYAAELDADASADETDLAVAFSMLSLAARHSEPASLRDESMPCSSFWGVAEGLICLYGSKKGDGLAARVSVLLPETGPLTGLDFPGRLASQDNAVPFADPLPMSPVTYIWRAYPRHGQRYYAALFWGNDDGKGTLETFLWTNDGDADSYYGAHPYPVPPPKDQNTAREISIERPDIFNGDVIYDRWFVQALRVSGGPAWQAPSVSLGPPSHGRKPQVLQRTVCPTWRGAPPSSRH